MGVVAKRSSMIFYSGSEDHFSHRVRIVLAEKGVAVDILDVSADEHNAELADLNPYNSVPTLLDRDLVLYESKVMMEYLDERFPHPPLLPVYPVARAQSRLWMHRIEREWCPLVEQIQQGSKKDAEKARKELRESLTGISPIFEDMPFFMSEEFTLVDCCIAPILWRLPALGVELPEKQVAPLMSYMERVFARDAFKVALSESEREMRS
ncbi:glutathione S-transferase N-terminal domain-containing protein [Salinicola sp. LHM]|jgi:RNA polymerase-associated protein|uniref:glutathione S-transferase N-terminal domain-containing protein n=1 Tax=unclassified Salinicola TaxID=2634022 RepID=UPI0008DDDD9B|nr:MULTISPECIES: glutathione S-transferase N-terminal domain-containing protein [unclassified Salinicola]MED5501561.1 glutathione S-transferase N-terminal domain-containing protein [Pseudomonadota bacterium]OHY97894.1 stringent starvation protein A [Salinicola sp. MIT1003]WQH34573.1 glutathione S-transferase N-terminal domain-containing protein [Salinicola sp. LHM]